MAGFLFLCLFLVAWKPFRTALNLSHIRKTATLEIGRTDFDSSIRPNKVGAMKVLVDKESKLVDVLYYQIYGSYVTWCVFPSLPVHCCFLLGENDEDFPGIRGFNCW